MAKYLPSWVASALPGNASGSSHRDSSPPSLTEVSDSGQDSTLNISKLVIYPIKSCGGIEIENSSYSISGLQYDRQWMLVDRETKKMITARTHPKSLLVRPSIDSKKGLLHLHIPDNGDFSVPLAVPKEGDRVEGLQVWECYDLSGWIVSPEGSELQEALSRLVGAQVLLLQFDDSAPRLLEKQQFLSDLLGDKEDALDYPLEDCTTQFADTFPFLIATESSFNDIESWLESEAPRASMDADELIKRYRPNIVVQGSVEPFDEDGWEELLFGEHDIILPVSRCPRCPLPDASPFTGEMSSDRMPGTIVNKHRKNVDRLEKGPCVGVHALPKSRAGRLSVGMTVRITKRAQLDTEGKLSGKWLRSEDRWG